MTATSLRQTTIDIDSREVRVFLSSTFADMQTERDYLLAKVFPELRRICREREVTLTEIDLRWGVREEDSRNGLTVEICLQEIDRCRTHPPFFIGMMGERYGWIPKREELHEYWQQHKDSPYALRIDRALDQGISVTELEIRYAFLENPDASNHARMFLRSPLLTDALRARATAPADKEFVDPAEGKLDTLKACLRQSPAMGIDGYDSIEMFGQAVRAFLLEQIDALHPASETPSPQELRDHAHAVFAHFRRQGYVPLSDMRTAARDAIASTPARVLISGASGLGKSALMADLAVWLPQEAHACVHAHYVGADGVRSLDGWVQRVFDFLQACHSLSNAPPQNAKDRWDALPTALLEVQRALGQPLVLLLDALDQLDDVNATLQQLSSLLLPRQVALVASATPELAHKARQGPNWQHLAMQPLDELTRRDAMDAFLRRYDKQLSEPLCDHIARDEATAVPLFLRLLLEELRLHALNETLPQRAEELLATRTADRLFLHALNALDYDFARPRQTDLATRAAQLMALSWRGIKAYDLAGLLATATNSIDAATQRPRLPDRLLSPLMAHLEPFCLTSTGRIAIMHAILRQVLVDMPGTPVLRRQLVEHFATDEPDAVAERVYQLWQLDDRPALTEELGRNTVLSVYRTESRLLRSVLEALGAGRNTPPAEIHDIAASWQINISADESVLSFGRWLTDSAFFGLAQTWIEAVLAWQRSQGAQSTDIATNLSNLGMLYQAQGKLEAAEPLCREALALRRQALPAGHPDIAKSLNNLATLYQGQGKFDAAEPLYQEALAMRSQALTDGHQSIATNLSNLAVLYQAQGKLDAAEPLCREALALRRQALPAGHPDIAKSLNNLAMLYQAQGKLNAAEPLWREALAMRRQALPAGHPDIAIGLNNLAMLYQAQGKLDAAEPLYQEALAINRQALPAGHPDIAKSLSNLAVLYQAQGKLEAAEPLYQEALELCRRALPAGHPDIAFSLYNLAGLYQAQGKFDAAEPLMQEALAMRRQALPAGHPDIATGLNNLAALYYAKGKLDAAEPLMQEALAIQRQTLPAGHPDIATSLNNLAGLYYAQGKLDAAEPLCREALAIRRQAFPGGHPFIVQSLNGLAALYQAQGKRERAEPLLQEVKRIQSSATGGGAT